MPARLKRRLYRALHPTRPRPPRVRLLEEVPKGSSCAEIGVWKGDFSARILEVVRPAKLHLVDPWRVVDDEAYTGALYGSLSGGQEQMDTIHAGVLERFAREVRDGAVEVHRLPSLDAVERFGAGELDFVYVDGNHLYEFVQADLDAWAKKIRVGGLLGGDDYGVRGWWDDGVTRAVDEFVGAGRGEVVLLEDRQFLLRLPG